LWRSHISLNKKNNKASESETKKRKGKKNTGLKFAGGGEKITPSVSTFPCRRTFW